MPATEERAGQKQDKAAVEAQVSIRYWREAEARKAEALSRLESAADSHFRGADAEQLIDQYQDACDEAERAQKGLGKTSHIPKHVREQHEAQVEQHAARNDWFKEQADLSLSDVMARQQAHERRRIELETARAALAAEARRGPISPAPGTESHPPDQQPVLSRFGSDVVTADPFAESKAETSGNLTYQDPQQYRTDAPGLATRRPAEGMTAGQAQEIEAGAPTLQEEARMEQREVDQRGQLLRESERQGKAEAQGEHQVGGPAHGRAENKKGGYAAERKGARPEPEPGQKEKK